MTAPPDLIARLEAATKGSRELSDEVLMALGFVGELDCTESVEDALALVPEGDYDQSWSKSTRGAKEGFKLWQVRLSLETVAEDPEETGPVSLGEAWTPALALCIALLRAEGGT